MSSLMIAQRTIISESAGSIFAIFSPNESVLGADDRSGPLFRYVKGRCHGNQFCEKWQLPSFVVLVFGNGMGYRYLNVVSINSVNDACISCKKFRELWSSNSRVDRALLWTSGMTRPKIAYLVEYLRIYWTDFHNLFTVWKHFGCRWWIGTLFFYLSRDVAMATK